MAYNGYAQHRKDFGVKKSRKFPKSVTVLYMQNPHTKIDLAAFKIVWQIVGWIFCRLVSLKPHNFTKK
jgi:hypothetical protein